MQVIVIGAGDVGYHIAQTLSRERHDVTVIESSDEVARKVNETLDVQVIRGSGSNPDVLQQAGIDQAEMLIAVTDRDEVNMVSCLIASFQAKILTKIARIRDEVYSKVEGLINAGPLSIDLCIHPEQEAAESALKLVAIPGVREVVEFAEGQILLTAVTVEADNPLVGRPLEAIEAQRGKTLIVALNRGTQLIIPRGKDVIRSGDELFLVTEREGVSSALKALGKTFHPVRRVIIMGAGKVALNLAHRLEGFSVATKLICPDKERCSQLVDEFDKVMVLHGEGADRDLLIEENVNGVDCFVSASDDEEANILVALLAKQLGARRTMALVRRLPYISLIHTLGVDVVINPQLAAVNRILRYIRKGKVLSVATLGGEQAEAIEFVALDTSDLVNRPLKDIRFPRDAIVGALVREEQIIIPHGDTVIVPGDRVIIFAKRHAIPAVEKALTVKLEYF